MNDQPLCPRLAIRLFLAAGLVAIASLQADEPTFHRHDLNPDSTYCACAAIDVNRDGRLDVVCGGWWYEAPSWKRHFLREVEVIRGRYDDYSNLPLDVNGDGWTDLVSANYRSQTIYWIEHPGPSLGAWTAHAIAKPGPMETARLVDVDGDGRIDVLPNPVRFAAWWEVTEGPNFEWIRHDLPQEAAGHSLGFGDLNGDGRDDIIATGGWLEAPEDRRRGTWRFHPEFQLNRDAGIPILVEDVDRDGDADLVWGRGHRTGLYWMERQTDSDGRRRWVRHAIDTSWSQPHSLLSADLDNDGHNELIAGKRYLGHDGKDPGEWDPLVIYWYKFDSTTKTWRRGVISPSSPAGVGLDPKAADLDGDGDVDLLVAGRSGLFWFENRLIHPADSVQPDPSQAGEPPSYADHFRLLVYQDDSGSEQPVTSPGDWAIRASHIRAAMQTVMGPLPPPSRRVPLDVELGDSVDIGPYTRTRLTYATEPGDRVPAYLLVPRDLDGKAPAMLCLHQTTSIGKGEPAGLGGRPTLHYAHELAEQGYVCIVPDYPSFGDYAYDFQAASHTDHYASGSMKAVWNNIRAIDLLETLPQVDPDRIGCIGHSLGGHNGLFTASFDLRIRAVVSSCGFTAFGDYYNGDLTGWTSDRYMPRIRRRHTSDPGEMPFDFPEILGVLAPRSVFINAPLDDSNFAVAGVRKTVSSAAEVYEVLGASGKLRVVYPDSSHDFPDAVRQDAYAWLRGALK